MHTIAPLKSLQATCSTSPSMLPSHLRLPSAGILLWQCDLLLLLREGEYYHIARSCHDTVNLWPDISSLWMLHIVALALGLCLSPLLAILKCARKTIDTSAYCKDVWQCKRIHNPNHRSQHIWPHRVCCLHICACLQQDFCCDSVTSPCCMVKGSPINLQGQATTQLTCDRPLHHFGCWILLLLLLVCVYHHYLQF